MNLKTGDYVIYTDKHGLGGAKRKLKARIIDFNTLNYFAIIEFEDRNLIPNRMEVPERTLSFDKREPKMEKTCPKCKTEYKITESPIHGKNKIWRDCLKCNKTAEDLEKEYGITEDKTDASDIDFWGRSTMLYGSAEIDNIKWNWGSSATKIRKFTLGGVIPNENDSLLSLNDMFKARYSDAFTELIQKRDDLHKTILTNQNTFGTSKIVIPRHNSEIPNLEPGVQIIEYVGEKPPINRKAPAGIMEDWTSEDHAETIKNYLSEESANIFDKHIIDSIVYGTSVLECKNGESGGIVFKNITLHEIDKGVIENENEKLIAGECISTITLDDHILHIKEHSNILEGKTPQIVERILDHISEHSKAYSDLNELINE